MTEPTLINLHLNEYSQILLYYLFATNLENLREVFYININMCTLNEKNLQSSGIDISVVVCLEIKKYTYKI